MSFRSAVVGIGLFMASHIYAFDATIPVVDMNDFYTPSTKQKFVDEVAQALHEFGFFAVVNADVDPEILGDAYRAFQQFCAAPQEMKNTLHFPELHGQRGYIPGETAQGSKAKDCKEFLHIGYTGNIWPNWMDLETPMMRLVAMLKESAESLTQAFAIAIGEQEDFLSEMIREGECLLRPIHYPQNPPDGRPWAAEHTDIDFFTILPMATEAGLQIWHQGKWMDVKVPLGAFIVNGGDMLQNMTNGYFKSSFHRVIAHKEDTERYSIVFFIHPRPNDSLTPTPNMIAVTGGIQRYPDATRLELLSSRLRELKLAAPALLQFEQDSGILERTRALVEAGVAAEPVIRTYQIWLENNPVDHP